MVRAVQVLAFATTLSACGRVSFDPHPDAALDPALVAWYPMDDPPEDGARDATANHFDATCDPTCPTSTSGVLRNGFAFAQGAALVLPEDPRLELDRGTIACWGRVDAIAAAYDQLISRSYGTQLENSIELYVTTSDNVYVGEDAMMPKSHISVPRPDVVGTWIHFAATWDAGTINLFLDGAPVGMATFATTFDAHPWRIGADFNNGAVTDTLVGALDDVRLYDRALSPTEISALATR